LEDNRGKTPWYRSEKIFRGVILLTIFLLGVVFILIGEKVSGFWSDFVGGMGVAFITTSVLGVVLESHLKERLFNDIKEELTGTLSAIRAQAIDAVHLNRLPMELLNVVRNTVTEAPIIERDIVATYRFTTVSIGRTKALKVEITTESILENLTDQSQNGDIFEGGVAIPARFKRNSTTADAGFVRIETEAIQGTSIPAPFTLDRAATQLYVSERNGEPQFRRAIQFSARCRLKVTTLEIAYYEKDDWDVFAVTKPSINMTVIASFPDGSFKLKGYPDDALIEYWDGDDEQGQWSVKGGLLPGQGINFEWEPDEEEEEEGG